MNNTKKGNTVTAGLRKDIPDEYKQEHIDWLIHTFNKPSFLDYLNNFKFIHEKITLDIQSQAGYYLVEKFKNDYKQIAEMFRDNILEFNYNLFFIQKEEKSQYSNKNLTSSQNIVKIVKSSQTSHQNIDKNQVSVYSQISDKTTTSLNNNLSQNQMSIEKNFKTLDSSCQGNEASDQKSSSTDIKSDPSQFIEKNQEDQAQKQKQALLKKCFHALKDYDFNYFLQENKSKVFQLSIKQVADNYIQNEFSHSNNKNVLSSIIYDVIQVDYTIEIKSSQLNETIIHGFNGQSNNVFQQLGAANQKIVEEDQVIVDSFEIQQSNKDNNL